jgi:TPP-dependent pyruvate/acetoin dehydrogenase alpha subunit
VPKELFEVWAERDPIDRYEKKLADDGIDIEEVAASVKEEIERETEWALSQEMPEPGTATQGVFASSDPRLGDGNAPWSRWKEAGNA